MLFKSNYIVIWIIFNFYYLKKETFQKVLLEIKQLLNFFTISTIIYDFLYIVGQVNNFLIVFISLFILYDLFIFYIFEETV